MERVGKYSESGTKFEHQVFLSFRGPDTRNFANHLFYALENKGFRVFKDDERLKYGKNIQLNLREAIGSSETSVVILSPKYAESRWCLDELVKIMELESLKVHSVLPVFFDVEPTEVRHQTGYYEKAFKEQEERFASKMDIVEKWRSALKQVGNLRGLSLSVDRNESQLVKDIIEKLRKIVNTNKLLVPSYIVGRETILKEISMWLRDGSPDVEVGLIYGLGGIGKSTIAMIAYNENLSIFDGCSFLAYFTRNITQPDGLARLLNQLIVDVAGKTGNKIHNVDKGLIDVRAVLCRKRLLLVFDDIDELKYLPDAFDDPNFFGKGSKIIITSRNEELRNVSLFKRKFRISGLEFEESKELLKLHAFIKKGNLSQHQEGILDGFLQRCHGHPLALYVLGPTLRNKTEEVWESLLEELTAYPDNELFNVFRLSLKCINDMYTKELFLYIACFFVGMDKAYALKILKGCKLRPISGLEKLIDRCLVTVDYRGKLMMHQSIEEMGKEVARQESVDEPGKRSKIWSTEDSKYVLDNDKGTSIIRGLCLYFPQLNSQPLSKHQNFENYPKLVHLAFNFQNVFNPWKYMPSINFTAIKTSSFANMSNLELLQLNHVQLDGAYGVFPKKLKWLLWRGCPFHSLPSDLDLNELVVLDLQKSSLLQAWKASKYMGALMILDLSYSPSLLCTPDLSRAPMLECLLLKGCVSLLEVHESIGNLTNLMHLNVEGCIGLLKVHKSIGNLKKLTILNLEGCKHLMSFPIPTSVAQLNLAECSNFFVAANQMEPSAISSSDSETVYSVSSPLPLYPVPTTHPCSPFNFYLPFLTEMKLVKCGISRDDVFEQLSCAPSLKYLHLRDNPIRGLSNKGMRSLSNLRLLSLRHCRKLKSISQLPRTCELNAELCSSLRRISYVYHPDPKPLIHPISAAGCAELVEVDYGHNDRLVLKLTDDMCEGQTNQLGFPSLDTFIFGSTLVDSEEDYIIKRGLYRGGTYQVYLFGNHIANWFTTTANVAELHYVVPCKQVAIRTLNLGFVGSGDVRDFDIYYVKIKNLTAMWDWTLHTSYGGWMDNDSCYITLTWLSHWCVMEHREIRSGDLLHISLSSRGFFGIEKWGIEVIYKGQHINEDAGKEHADNDNIRKTCDIYSGRSRKQKVDDHRVDLEEMEDGPPRPHCLDLSIYEVKGQTDTYNDECENQKPKEYHIPHCILLR